MSVHKSVLLNEIIEGLNLKNDSLILDCTFGGGGHSREILKKHKEVRIIALDQDKSVSKNILDKRIIFYNLNFRDLDKAGVLSKKFDGIIFDLGLSSDQLEDSGRGFSFMKDEPLLMTIKENPSSEDLTAEDIVNEWSEENLAKIIYGYGEEKFAKKIARGISEARKAKKIKTTKELAEIIRKSVPLPYQKKKIHFATKTFQALRIAVNDELGALTEGLKKGFEALDKRGRMAVISFHSLEDRIVKRFYKEKVKEKKAILINKKPITVKREEIKENPRSRSAKLRVLQKI